MFERRMLAALSGAAAAGLMGVAAFAANPEPVVVEVQFVEPITITETNPLQFGMLDVGMVNNDTITIATDGTPSGDLGNLLNADQAAAGLTVTATAGQAINILVNNVANGAYYALGTFECDYDGNGATACDGTGLNTTSVASATLTIGATLTKNGTPATAIVDNGSFDVTVAYQ